MVTHSPLNSLRVIRRIKQKTKKFTFLPKFIPTESLFVLPEFPMSLFLFVALCG